MDVTTLELKHCWSCDRHFSATTEYFHSDSSQSCGLSGSCKKCSLERKEAWRKANPVKANSHALKYRCLHPVKYTPKQKIAKVCVMCGSGFETHSKTKVCCSVSCGYKNHQLKSSKPKKIRISRKVENQKYIWAYKEHSCCIYCGEQQPEVLMFHHREPNEKSFTISEVKTRPLDEVKAEIAKCDLLCANCHMSLHYWEKRE